MALDAYRRFCQSKSDGMVWVGGDGAWECIPIKLFTLLQVSEDQKQEVDDGNEVSNTQST